MAMFSSIEPFLAITLHPIVVLLFSLWLTLPNYQGTKTIYAVSVRPIFHKYESYIEQKIDGVKSKANQMFLYILSETGWSIFHHIMIIAHRIRKNSMWFEAENLE